MFTILFGTFISINIFLVEEFSSFEFNVIFMMLKAFEKFQKLFKIQKNQKTKKTHTQLGLEGASST